MNQNALPMAHGAWLMAGRVLAVSHVPWARRGANLTHLLQLVENKSPRARSASAHNSSWDVSPSFGF